MAQNIFRSAIDDAGLSDRVRVTSRGTSSWHVGEPADNRARTELLAHGYSDAHTAVGVGARLQGDTVEIAVTDQGPGIPEHEQTRIFERFYRMDAARSRATGGTGLGLSIVKHICANHGGDIQVWSDGAHGSTFTIRLPVAAESLEAVTPQPPTPTPTPKESRT